ncbi:MAG: PAS domain-containing protein, partial [Chloroflexi bacterium]|nr:PAS domain-containing protein [Chloroflexota bacterium]
MNLENWRKFKLAQKLWIGFGFLILILALTVIVAYWQADQADDRLDQLANIQVPSEQAVFEMKASASEIDRSLQDYSQDGSPAHLETAGDAEADFESLISEFNVLAADDQIRQSGQQVSSLFEESSGLRSDITMLFDQQSTEIKALLEDIEDISESVDNRLIVQIDPGDPHAATKLEAAFGLKFDMLAISQATNDYTSNPDTTRQQKVQDAQADFQGHMEMYRGTALTTLEESWLAEIGDDFDDVMSDGSNLMALTEDLDELLTQHEQDTNEIIVILDNEIQPIIRLELAKSANDAGDSLDAARIWTIVLGVLGLVVGGVLAWIVSRRVVKSLQNLQRVAKSVADGKLGQRFYIDTKDEFGLVAITLNQMLENIGRSREALGESEETAWQLLDATTDSVILMDLRGTILATNEVAAERFDKSLEQMIDASYYDLLPADLMASRKSQIAEVIKTGKPFHFEEDRKGMVLDTRVFPVVNPNNGRVTRVSIFARDITTRKWVEDVTEHLGRRNELILEAAGEGIYGLDTQGKTTFV